jgi:hypothetical protein
VGACAARWDQTALRNGLRLCKLVSRHTHQLDVQAFGHLLRVFRVHSNTVAQRLFRAALGRIRHHATQATTCQTLVVLATCKLPTSAEWLRQRASVAFHMYGTATASDEPVSLGKSAFRQMLADVDVQVCASSGKQATTFASHLHALSAVISDPNSLAASELGFVEVGVGCLDCG